MVDISCAVALRIDLKNSGSSFGGLVQIGASVNYRLGAIFRELRSEFSQDFLANDFAIIVHIGDDPNVKISTELSFHVVNGGHHQTHSMER